MISKLKKHCVFRTVIFGVLCLLLFNGLLVKPVEGTAAYGVTFQTCKNVFSAEDVSTPSVPEEPTTEANGDAPVPDNDIPKTGGTVLLICIALGSAGISAAILIWTQKKRGQEKQV